MQLYDGIADCAEHAFNLVIFALANRKARNTVVEYFQPSGQQSLFFTMQEQAARELFDGAMRNRLGGLQPIGFFAIGFWRGDAMRPLTVIGQQHKTRGVDIEPASDV